jgi:hypothetical protein
MIERDGTGESEGECPSIKRTRGNSDVDFRSRDCEEKIFIVAITSYYEIRIIAYFGQWS